VPHHLHVSHPEWVAAVDLLPEQVVAARQRLVGCAADEGMLVHTDHFPWPGLGRAVAQTEGRRWEPVG
jgi:hypothetical protein